MCASLSQRSKRAILLCEGDMITVEDLPMELRAGIATRRRWHLSNCRPKESRLKTSNATSSCKRCSKPITNITKSAKAARTYFFARCNIASRNLELSVPTGEENETRRRIAGRNFKTAKIAKVCAPLQRSTFEDERRDHTMRNISCPAVYCW